MHPLSQEPVSLLLIEDNIGHALLFENMLRREGFANPLTVLPNGVDAVSLLTNDAFDRNALVILDLNLPLIHGSEILRPVRDQWTAEQLPIIVVSTSLDEQEIEVCTQLGTQAHLPKPVEPQSWAHALDQLGDQYKVRPTESGKLLVKC